MNYKNIIFKSSFLVLVFSIFFLFGQVASADSTCNCKIGSSFKIDFCGVANQTCAMQCGSISNVDSCVENPPSLGQVDPKLPSLTQVEPQELPNPLGISDVNLFIARVINFVLGLIGSVSLLMFIYGGLTWMTSAGAGDRIKKGRDIIVWSVIGLAIVFTAYIMVKFVIQSLAG